MNTLAHDDKTAPAAGAFSAPSGARPTGGIHRGIWIGGALMGVTIVALATALVVKGHGGDSAPAPTPLASVATVPGTTASTCPTSW